MISVSARRLLLSVLRCREVQCALCSQAMVRAMVNADDFMISVQNAKYLSMTLYAQVTV